MSSGSAPVDMGARLVFPAHRMIRLHLPPESSGRLDAVLSAMLPHLSRRRLRAAFREGSVFVEGRKASKADSAIPGAVVELDLPEELTGAPCGPLPAPEVSGSLLGRWDGVLALNKPAGVPTVPLDHDEPGTLAGYVAVAFPLPPGTWPEPLSCGIAHRLDRETSGVVLAARTAEIWSGLRRAFADGAVHKTYEAVVCRVPESEEGVVEMPIGRRRGRARRLIVVEGSERGVRKVWPAKTRWRLVRSAHRLALVEAAMDTGVTHQIRVHLAHAGIPVAGDPLYGGEVEPGAPVPPRIMLHARSVAFRHPVSGEQLLVEAPRPPEFEELLRLATAAAPGGQDGGDRIEEPPTRER